jgi:hypothetical protein
MEPVIMKTTLSALSFAVLSFAMGCSAEVDESAAENVGSEAQALDTAGRTLVESTDRIAKTAALLESCDGAAGSKKAFDKCGVCGGDGKSCEKPCGDIAVRSNGMVWVEHRASAAPHGTTVSYPAGRFALNGGIVCFGVYWAEATLQCNDGSWRWTKHPAVGEDSGCGARNASWSGAGGSLATGFTL